MVAAAVVTVVRAGPLWAVGQPLAVVGEAAQ